MKAITIKVTATDIKRGEVAESRKCPIALAIKRITGRKQIAVGLEKIYFSNRIDSVPYLMEPDVAKFVKDFDNGKKVKPFSFIIVL